MANDNREYKPEEPSGEPHVDPDSNKHPDHPFLGGGDRPRPANSLLHFPARPQIDPMSRLPSDPARDAERQAFELNHHDPSVDYQPPNPMSVIPPASPVLKILGVIAGLLLFVLVAMLLFRNWMSPLPRHPGEHTQGQGLEQKLP